MRNNFKAIFLLLCILLFAMLLMDKFNLENTNADLVNQIKERDSLYIEMAQRSKYFDSLARNYKNEMEGYFNNCTFQLGDKEISAQEVARIANSLSDKKEVLEAEKRVLHDSIEILNKKLDYYRGHFHNTKSMPDSLDFYKTVYRHLLRKYEIVISTTPYDGGNIISSSSPKIDSAMLLLPYYRQKLRDKGNGEWSIILDNRSEKKSKKR